MSLRAQWFPRPATRTNRSLLAARATGTASGSASQRILGSKSLFSRQGAACFPSSSLCTQTCAYPYARMRTVSHLLDLLSRGHNVCVCVVNRAHGRAANGRAARCQGKDAAISRPAEEQDRLRTCSLFCVPTHPPYFVPSRFRAGKFSGSGQLRGEMYCGRCLSWHLLL